MQEDRSGSVLGHYKIDALLGRGGMGEVYRATDTRKGRVVALKLLRESVADDPAFRDRFLRESRVAASLNDPHVIPIHDWGEIEGLLYIDMRLVDGHDLRALLDATGPLAPSRALSILSQIADALDTAHRGGLIHRDVKPDNILIDRRDFAYLVDFGLAQADTDTRMTSAGTAIGSFGYMAPERFGDSPLGAPADIYALGCVLYECLAGAHPFASATTVEQLIAAHLAKQPPSLSSPLDSVIARAMAKDPAQRYLSAGDMIDDARALQTATGIKTLTPRVAPPTVTPSAPPTMPPAYLSTAARPVSPPPPTGGQPTLRASADRFSGPHPNPQYPNPQYPNPQYPNPPYPSYPAPEKSRSIAVPAALTAIVVLVIAIGAVGWVLFTSGSDDSKNAADVSREPQTVTVERATPQVTETTAETTVETTAGQTPPFVPTTTQPTTPQRGTGDLGLATPISRPACDGTGIVVVANAVTPGQYASEVQGYLNSYPGFSYLRTDQSCPSLRQNLNGNPIYAVYKVAGTTLSEICALRSQIGGDAYGKWLDTTSNPTSYITC
ncbi:serine/threonine-protein kinase [Gordonia sp. ABSL49_1]|uniref:serine/threonine-protein kinase n=1 Tax=Gordonia sp. ABSL49_1 TaxID=2920941 RepID=UPI001F116536|nr:serine/threonine-protein kinase [Gordonia sp. ABSL49_1]MCH5645388.1 serine/threonine protein kinase [Gordonia sp. ABSL49_1]